MSASMETEILRRRNSELRPVVATACMLLNGGASPRFVSEMLAKALHPNGQYVWASMPDATDEMKLANPQLYGERLVR